MWTCASTQPGTARPGTSIRRFLLSPALASQRAYRCHNTAVCDRNGLDFGLCCIECYETADEYGIGRRLRPLTATKDADQQHEDVRNTVMDEYAVECALKACIVTQADEIYRLIAAESHLPADAARQLRDAGFVVMPGPPVSGGLECLSQAYDHAVAMADPADVGVSISIRVTDFVNRGKRSTLSTFIRRCWLRVV